MSPENALIEVQQKSSLPALCSAAVQAEHEEAEKKKSGLACCGQLKKENLGSGPPKKFHDEDGIRTHACRAHWISSPTP